MTKLSFAVLIFFFLSSTIAHTTLTNFYIDGKAVTPGKCIRMSQNPARATDPLPVASITGDDIACGVDGEKGVQQSCDINDGSLLTFNFRACPEGTCDNGAKAVPIDVSHRGTCAVYMKRVDNSSDSTNAAGPGWFKIFQNDYNEAEKKWCTDKIIESGGLLSANIPQGLQEGDYLIRTEILALHQADKSPADPQFYVGCVQTHVTSSGSGIPSDTVNIPGYIDMQNNAATLTYHVWDEDNLVLPFPAFGPPVYSGGASQTKISLSSNRIKVAAITSAETTCIIENGNWCGTQVPSFHDAATCATSHKNCWAQSTECYDIASKAAIGHANCTAWENYCTANDNACNSGRLPGPAENALQPVQSLPSIKPPQVLQISPGSSSPADPSVSSPSPASNPDSTQVSESPSQDTGIAQIPSIIQSTTGSISECGSRNQSAICAQDLCCSAHGYCGSSSDYCGAGCQNEFGVCPQAVSVRSIRLHSRSFVVV